MAFQQRGTVQFSGFFDIRGQPATSEHERATPLQTPHMEQMVYTPRSKLPIQSGYSIPTAAVHSEQAVFPPA
jgi:hypothetical protein